MTAITPAKELMIVFSLLFFVTVLASCFFPS
ncbi:unknown [Clostridium sp. CAG:169]|nr:unknown [Clostridium sp. CAG:169]